MTRSEICFGGAMEPNPLWLMSITQYGNAAPLLLNHLAFKEYLRIVVDGRSRDSSSCFGIGSRFAFIALFTLRLIHSFPTGQ